MGGGGKWLRLERDGVDLACFEYSRDGPLVMLLHGLLGHAREWDDTASWLARNHRVRAVDHRGHGRSTRLPHSMAPEELALDVVAWIRDAGAGPAVLVGHSFGGVIALLVAARHPDMARGLVMVEASPSADPQAPARVARWLNTWPKAFPTRESALDFFGGDGLRARAWCHGLVPGDRGLIAAFDPPVVLGGLIEATRDHWPEWRTLRCPTQVVRAESGLPEDEVSRMAAAVSGATVATIYGARHDVHLEQPRAWREVLLAFLASLDQPADRSGL